MMHAMDSLHFCFSVHMTGKALKSERHATIPKFVTSIKFYGHFAYPNFTESIKSQILLDFSAICGNVKLNFRHGIWIDCQIALSEIAHIISLCHFNH